MKKKNPTDTTLRNTRAANKRIKALEEFAEYVLARFKSQTKYNANYWYKFNSRLEKLEKKPKPQRRK